MRFFSIASGIAEFSHSSLGLHLYTPSHAICHSLSTHVFALSPAAHLLFPACFSPRTRCIAVHLSLPLVCSVGLGRGFIAQVTGVQWPSQVYVSLRAGDLAARATSACASHACLPLNNITSPRADVLPADGATLHLYHTLRKTQASERNGAASLKAKDGRDGGRGMVASIVKSKKKESERNAF